MRAATTRKPTCSNRRNTSPIRFRPTPSGLMMERVRSMGMIASDTWDLPPFKGPTKTAKCTGAAACRQSGCQPKCLYYLEKRGPCGNRKSTAGLHVEALAAAAFAFGFGVLKLEGLI